MADELIKAPPQFLPPVALGFDTVEGFNGLQRVAKALADSSIIPEAFRGNFSSCLIAADIAVRAQISPLVVMQSLYVIQGKPSFKAEYLIAQARSSGHPITWKIDRRAGKIQNIPDMSVTAVMASIEGAEMTCDTQMAVDEGWATKPGNKYRTMAELMLRYRSATFLCRLYLPNVTLGLPTSDEVEDILPAPEAKRDPIRLTSHPEPKADKPEAPGQSSEGEETY